jgi:hypothetical protein
MVCVSVGAAAVIYFTKQEARQYDKTELESSEEMSMQSEHILKRIMRADSVQHNCGANSTPACCDKSCRAIKYQLIHNWEVI